MGYSKYLPLYAFILYIPRNLAEELLRTNWAFWTADKTHQSWSSLYFPQSNDRRKSSEHRFSYIVRY